MHEVPGYQDKKRAAAERRSRVRDVIGGIIGEIPDLGGLPTIAKDTDRETKNEEYLERVLNRLQFILEELAIDHEGYHDFWEIFRELWGKKIGGTSLLPDSDYIVTEMMRRKILSSKVETALN